MHADPNNSSDKAGPKKSSQDRKNPHKPAELAKNALKHTKEATICRAFCSLSSPSLEKRRHDPPTSGWHPKAEHWVGVPGERKKIFGRKKKA